MNTKIDKYPPGDFGIWLIIYIELITFGGLFLGYAFIRSKDVELFNNSQDLLNQNFGLFNTVLLLTSSYFVVKAVHFVKNGLSTKKSSKYMLFAIALGAGFLLLKALEFFVKYNEGISIGTNTFFMFYYILTIFHFLHVLLGIAILFLTYKNMKKNKYTSTNCIGLETSASYWHMVDLLWIILFPLIYIIR
ncbi:cytochrome c oxidase subunit 3 [Poseidonibacter lekithochrous]|uniref:cytochrome c oxidase subunit 3 n=1 Tax=Poseidonibacter lekithochrous TaxID=1904463 RepID=UPI000D3482AE|nr:cytochrome c oxidase subunit 3 [Poseidonibacter lekithochrous]